MYGFVKSKTFKDILTYSYIHVHTLIMQTHMYTHTLHKLHSTDYINIYHTQIHILTSFHTLIHTHKISNTKHTCKQSPPPDKSYRQTCSSQSALSLAVHQGHTPTCARVYSLTRRLPTRRADSPAHFLPKSRLSSCPLLSSSRSVRPHFLPGTSWRENERGGSRPAPFYSGRMSGCHRQCRQDKSSTLLSSSAHSCPVSQQPACLPSSKGTPLPSSPSSHEAQCLRSASRWQHSHKCKLTFT